MNHERVDGPYSYIQLVRYVPWWFPGARFKKGALQRAEKTIEAIEKPYAIVEAAVVGVYLFAAY